MADRRVILVKKSTGPAAGVATACPGNPCPGSASTGEGMYVIDASGPIRPAEVRTVRRESRTGQWPLGRPGRDAAFRVMRHTPNGPESLSVLLSGTKSDGTGGAR